MATIELFSVFGRIKLDDADFNRGISSAEESGRGLGAVMAGVGKAIVAAGVAIGAALVGVGTKSLLMREQMNNSLGAIQAQTGQTAEDIQKTENAVRALALEQGRFTAIEMFSALEGVSRRGQDSAYQVLMLEHSMRLADLSSKDFGTSMYTLDALMVKFNTDVQDASKWVNTLAVAQQEMNISQTSMLDGLQRSAGIANAAGLSYDFLAAALGFAYQGGQSMANASTGLVGIFNQMLDPASNIREAMEELGVATITNADGTINAQDSMIKFMRELDNADPLMREQINNTMGLSGSNLDLFTNLIDNIHALDEQSAMFKYAMLAGADYARVAEMIENRTGGMGETFGLLRNQGRELFKMIGDLISQPFIEMLEEAAGEAGNLVEQLKEGGALRPYIERMGEAIVVMGRAIFDMGMALVPVVIEWLPKLAYWVTRGIELISRFGPEIATAVAGFKLWKIIGPILSPIIGYLGKLMGVKGLGGLKALLPGVGGAFKILLGPIGLIGAAIIGLVAYFVHLFRTNEDFRDRVLGIWENIRERGTAIWESLRTVFSDFVNLVQPLIDLFRN